MTNDFLNNSKIMKQTKLYILTSLFLSIGLAKANSTNDYLIHISDYYDKHPTYIKSYSIGYWIPQASILKKSSKLIFTSSAPCTANYYGNAVLLLEPHIFYNPLMKTLYGDISTKVYGNAGNIITTIKSEDEVQGSLSILHETLIDQLYRKILVKLQDQISINEKMNAYLKQKKGVFEGTFCLTLN